jgi:hypothetical protein
MYLRYPQWQEPLAAAILEFDALQLRGKLQKAEDAISKRFKELEFEKDNQDELRALADGLFLIKSVRKDRLDSTGTAPS